MDQLQLYLTKSGRFRRESEPAWALPIASLLSLAITGQPAQVAEAYCFAFATRTHVPGVVPFILLPLQIHFSPIPQELVDKLIAEGEVFWCAGGLMVEHPLVTPHVTRMVGALDSVMGLDKQLLLRLLCAVASDTPSGQSGSGDGDGSSRRAG